jgi:hypothetical protein
MGPIENRNSAEFLEVLMVGRCEPLKAGVHGVLMATVAVCAIYNIAAWLRRREPHLAFNTLVYASAAVWELNHVQQHLACRPLVEQAEPDTPALRNVA